jgi:site-specific DNA recombinase
MYSPNSRIALYTRISSDPDDAKVGVERQEVAARALCEQEGWTDVTVFRDNNHSAWSGKSRPRYLAMLDAIKQNKINIVVAWHQDRLHRRMDESLAFGELARKHGVRVITVMGGEDDLRTARGRFNANNTSAAAAYESDRISERVKAGLADRAAAGKVHTGGAQPYGWRKDRKTLNKREAAVVREMIMRVLDGDSLSAITRDLNARGIKTAAGVRWSHRRVRETILRHRNAGLRIHNGEVVATGEWEPIVSPEDFWQVYVILDAPERRSHLGNRGKAHLLSGIAKCGKCGAKIIASKGRAYKGVSKDVYRCGDHAHLGRLEAPIDEHVTAEILKQIRLKTTQLPVDDRNDPALSAAQQVAKLQDQLAKAAEAFNRDAITMEQLETITSGLRPKLKQALAGAAATGTPLVITKFYGPGNNEDIWNGLSLATRRRLIAESFDVVILPANHKGPGFNPETVKVTRKG